MNIFIFFFLTTAVVTAAPHAASTADKHQQKSGKPVNCTNHEYHRKSRDDKKTDQYLLKEIIKNVKSLKCNLTEKILQKHVQNVFIHEICNREMLCKAGNILAAFNASSLGLKSERDWRLPRRLYAYSKVNCTNTDELENVPLEQLLDKIYSCAQKQFAAQWSSG